MALSNAEKKKRYRAKPETKEKERAYDKTWRNNNREHVNAKRRERYHANKNGARDKILNSCKTYRLSKPDNYLKSYIKKNYKTDSDEIINAISINIKIKRLWQRKSTT